MNRKRDLAIMLTSIVIFMVGTFCAIHYPDVQNVNGSYMVVAIAIIAMIVSSVVLFGTLKDIAISEAKFNEKEKESGDNDSDNQRI